MAGRAIHAIGMRIALLGMGFGVLVAAAVGCTWETGDPDVGGAAAGDSGVPDLSPACSRACGALVAGGCTAQTEQACGATCAEWAKSWPQCTAELGAYLDCEAFSGQCNASACVEKFAQWQVCTNAGCTRSPARPTTPARSRAPARAAGRSWGRARIRGRAAGWRRRAAGRFSGSDGPAQGRSYRITNASRPRGRTGSPSVVKSFPMNTLGLVV